MIKINRLVPVDIEPTPQEIAKEIWLMYDTEQVDMLLALSRIYDEHTSDFLMQLSYIESVINKELTQEEKTKIIHMFESILEYLKEEKE